MDNNSNKDIMNKMKLNKLFKRVIGILSLNIYPSNPKSVIEKSFLMPIEAVWSISGSSMVVATGKIEQGKVKIGDEVEAVGFGKCLKTTIAGIEMSRKEVTDAQAGDNVGLLLEGIKKEEIEYGMVLSK